MKSARSVISVFFPLDEQLELVPGMLTPLMHEREVRLGVWMPFGRSVVEMKWFCGIDVSKSQVRRATERAGAEYVTMQTVEAERLAQMPMGLKAPDTPELLSLTVDGAMVSLVGGGWAEVKTMVISEIATNSDSPSDSQKDEEMHSTNHSYFSRMIEAKDYVQEALVETERRGISHSKQVCAVTDGAEWIQNFVSAHRPDAIRILDFYHAAEHLAEVGRKLYGEDSLEFKVWYVQQRHELRHGDPKKVLNELHTMAKQDQLSDSLKSVIEACIHYFESRLTMIQYATFSALGYPVGSGVGEACHKYVIQQRMKQAGMHWAKANVNPMVALRNMACNDRWDEGMRQLVHWHHKQARLKFAAKHTKRLAESTALTPAQPKSTHPSLLPPDFKLKPATPWCDQPIGKAKLNSALRQSSAK